MIVSKDVSFKNSAWDNQYNRGYNQALLDLATLIKIMPQSLVETAKEFEALGITLPKVEEEKKKKKR